MPIYLRSQNLMAPGGAVDGLSNLTAELLRGPREKRRLQMEQDRRDNEDRRADLRAGLDAQREDRASEEWGINRDHLLKMNPFRVKEAEAGATVAGINADNATRQAGYAPQDEEVARAGRGLGIANPEDPRQIQADSDYNSRKLTDSEHARLTADKLRADIEKSKAEAAWTNKRPAGTKENTGWHKDESGMWFRTRLDGNTERLDPSTMKRTVHGSAGEILTLDPESGILMPQESAAEPAAAASGGWLPDWLTLRRSGQAGVKTLGDLTGGIVDGWSGDKIPTPQEKPVPVMRNPSSPSGKGVSLSLAKKDPRFKGMSDESLKAEIIKAGHTVLP